MKNIFLTFIKKYMFELLVINVITFVLSIEISYIPLITRNLVECNNAQEMALYIVFTIIIGLSAWKGRTYIASKQNEFKKKLLAETRIIMFQKLDRVKQLPKEKDLRSFIEQDSAIIINNKIEILFEWISIICGLISGLFVVWYYLSNILTLALFITCLITLIIIVILQKMSIKYIEVLDKSWIKFRSILQGFSIMFKDYYLNNNTSLAHKKIIEMEKEYTQICIENQKKRQNLKCIIMAIENINTVLLVLALKIIAPQTSTIDIMMLLSYYLYIYYPMEGIAYLQDIYSDNIVIENRVNEILSLTEIENEDNKIELKDIESIKLNNIVYEVEAPDKTIHTILDKITLKINKGDTIGLIGSSGAGKSTLVKLIYQDIMPTSGGILINNEPISSYKRTSIFNKIFVVPQEFRSLEGTVADNLLIANANVTDKELKLALVAAGLEYLDLNELVGSKDTRELSGGEKQRLAIARLYLRRESVEIIILDEATSALDEATQADVLSTVYSMAKKDNKIVISIAHRLSTIKHCNKIIVLSDGKIVECGSHEELMNKNGIYYSLNNAADNIILKI